MSADNHDLTSVLLAFAAGAAIGAAAVLLLTPVSGREVRGRLADLGESSADEVRRLAREAKFLVTPKGKETDYRYDGGDAWI